MMSETLGKIDFWMLFLGFQLAFFPMHFAGLLGMPRRVYTYPAGLGLELPNFLSTHRRFRRRRGGCPVRDQRLRFPFSRSDCSPNPWGASTLEWATSSPPRAYNFAHIPVVESHTPLWDEDGELPVITGLRVDEKETLLTTVVAATPDLREPIAEAEPVAVHCCDRESAILFIRRSSRPGRWSFGAIPATIALTAWFWPKNIEARSRAGDHMIRPCASPTM